MTGAAWRIELELEPGRDDPVGEAARDALVARGVSMPGEVRSSRGFLLPAALRREDVERAIVDLLADPVTERALVVAPGAAPADGRKRLAVRRLAGVADPEGASAARALRLLSFPLGEEDRVESFRGLRLVGLEDVRPLLAAAARALANPVIEEVLPGDRPLGLHPAPRPRPAERREVPLREADEGRLAALSTEMGLALSAAEMAAIRDFFRAAGREPTDVELETLAQTWSEHCKHKTLTGPVHYRELAADGTVVAERHYRNLLKETVFAATRRLAPDWCWSVFADNAGVVALTDEIGIAVKVETHNHPSALDPYGGAGTGIGGVIRDILGTGLGARPFAATDVFCVGPAGLDPGELPPGTLPPDRILEGVVAGVRDYGNRMGIPTVAGTVVRHPGYVANPLVYAGCLGEIPRDCVDKAARPGDAIVAIGGRTGRDGIHGATFSSEALHEESETTDAAAVQIGDPITEKKVLDVLLEARDLGLYHAVTDCGAGGFSSAVGEMGEDCGAEVELSRAPLKYPGLGYWEIWISEAQERMVLAVPPESLDAFLARCAAHEVEASVLGRFTDDRTLRLRWHGEVVAELPMDFLHGGVPQPERLAELRRPKLAPTAWPEDADLRRLLLAALAHPSLASKEWVVRQYDHEVQGGTVVKPYQGPLGRGPGDGTVVKPRLELSAGVAIGCGLAPRIAEIDPWAGAACAIDEAVRNVVAAGGDPHRTALLDNFCWGDCRKPDRFGSLVAAAEACRDLALAYGAPFISGKDSLNNEYRVGGEERPIPPTLLCTAVAPVADTRRAATTPLKRSGDLLLLVGTTVAEAGGGSVAADLLGLADSQPPRPDLERAPALFDAVHQLLADGLAVACHDLAEGGLAAAAAEMVLGADRLGARLEVEQVPATGPRPLLGLLFAESPSRFLLEVAPADLAEAGSRLRGLPWAAVGEVTADSRLALLAGGREILGVAADELAEANGVQS
ncbi:MAG: phosphoribosylformylglycinamidine synthase subunit PurL [Planctomycetota bacterium]|nr:MAG: phosphoribosylformylglycinamidine synthase subunit PurL [Planctomycetota bacterium]